MINAIQKAASLQSLLPNYPLSGLVPSIQGYQCRTKGDRTLSKPRLLFHKIEWVELVDDRKFMSIEQWSLQVICGHFRLSV